MKKFPKVLVISHNVFSNTSNMGKTLATFFKGWDSNSLAQLYLHSEKTNVDICSRYFRITDFDMLEGIFKFSSPGEPIISDNLNLNAKSTRVDVGFKANIYQYKNKKKPYISFLRNLLWSTDKWYTKKLSKWIDDFNPEVVFFAAGDYSFSIKLAIKICKEKGIPMVVYFGDEYYLLNKYKYSFFNSINNKIFKKSFDEMFSYLNTFITASDKMQEEYNSIFKKQGFAIMTSTELAEESRKEKENNDVKISYIGNLGLDRWKPLVEIGRVLKEKNLILDVYSSERGKEVLAPLNEDNGVIFHGEIPSGKVKEVINASTLIVHVESMDEINKKRTRYSMSTKIAESLGSGVCLFAYGPRDISSIEYLLDNDAAFVVLREEDLQQKLTEILKSGKMRKKYITNALNLVSKRHDFELNTSLFYKIIVEASKDK